MTFWDEYCKKYGNNLYPVVAKLMEYKAVPPFKVYDDYGGEVTEFTDLETLCSQCEQAIGEPYCLRHDPDTSDLTDGPITRSDALYLLHTTLMTMLKNLYFSRLTREQACSLCNILSITDGRNFALSDEMRFNADEVAKEWNYRHPGEKKIEKQGIDYPS